MCFLSERIMLPSNSLCEHQCNIKTEVSNKNEYSENTHFNIYIKKELDENEIAYNDYVGNLRHEKFYVQDNCKYALKTEIVLNVKREPQYYDQRYASVNGIGQTPFTAANGTPKRQDFTELNQEPCLQVQAKYCPAYTEPYSNLLTTEISPTERKNVSDLNTAPRRKQIRVRKDLERGTFYCSACHEPYDTREATRRHVIRVHNSKNYKCVQCGRSFYSKGYLAYHVDSVHLKVKRFDCSECDRRFARKSYLTYHINVVHKKVKKLACEDCSYICSKMQALKRHTDTVHKNIKDFACTDCKKVFSQKASLVSHVQYHHTDGLEFTCCECGHAFTTKYSLNKHIDAVHKRKKNECCECKRSFADKAYLRIHMNHAHRKDLNVTCGLCDRIFVTKQVLLRHIDTVHKGLKNFECSECHRFFTQKAYLRAHISKKHPQGNLIKLRVFICNECKRSFTCKSSLERHILITNIH